MTCKHRRPAIVAVLVLVAAAAFGFPLRMLLPGLPSDSGYQASIAWMEQNPNLVDVWNSEWKFSTSKDEVTRRVKDALSQTDNYLRENLSSEDLWLFRVLLKQYLYNLDVTSYHDQIIKDIETLRTMYPTDYRPPWLLASFYCKAALATESIEVYEGITNKYQQDSLSPYFWVDYAEAEYFAGMPVSARDALQRAAQSLGNDFLHSNALYKAVNKLLVDPVAGLSISAEETNGFVKQGKDYAFLSRVFGMWIPVKSEWKVGRGGTNDDKTYVSLGLGPLQTKSGRNITYAIIVLSSANNKIPFEQYISQSTPKGASLKKIPDILSDLEQQTYEWTNPKLYQEAGGGHGMMVFIRRHEPKVRGLAIERPAPIADSASTGLSYYRFNKVFLRYPGDIYYSIILDSCNDIFKPATEEFRWFLHELVLE